MTSTHELRVVMLGPPGSGKGTQAKFLAEKAGIPAISTGEMLRDAVAAGSELGKKVEAIMASGSLVDDDTMAEVVRNRLEAADVAGGFLLDGYPRTLRQASDLAAILAEKGIDLDVVVSLEVPIEELVQRSLLRQRADDTEEVIRNRQEVYRDNTAPLVDYYRHRKLLCEVDGHQAIDAVTEAIFESLELS